MSRSPIPTTLNAATNSQIQCNPIVVDGVLYVPTVGHALVALNAATLSELESAFDTAASDAGTRVVLLTGAGGRAFAAGADIRELADLPPEEGRAFSLRGQAIFRRIETLGKPVVGSPWLFWNFRSASRVSLSSWPLTCSDRSNPRACKRAWTVRWRQRAPSWPARRSF